MSEGLPLKPLQPARPLSQVQLLPGSAEEAIASIRAFGTSFPKAAGSQAAQTSTTLHLPTVSIAGQSQQSQAGAPPAKKPRRRQPKEAQEQASTSQLSIPQGPQQVQQPQTVAPPSQKARQPRISLKRSIDSVEPSTSQEVPATKKPALQVSQPTQPEIQALPSTVALQASQQTQQSQTQAPPSQKTKQPRKSLKRSIDSVEPSASQEGPATKKPALQVSQPAQPQTQAPPSTVAQQAPQPTQPEIQASQSTQPEIQVTPSTVALQVSQSAQPEIQATPSTVALQAPQPAQPQIQASPSTATLQAPQSPLSGTQAPASTIDLPPHQPAQQLQFQAPRTGPIPGAWWEVPGFSEAFKQFHRDRYGKEGTLKPFVVQGIIDLAVNEWKRLHAAAAAARQAAENQGAAANPTAPGQETDPVSENLQALVSLSGGQSSEMGADDQQADSDPPIDPQLQAEYEASSMDPRAHKIRFGGVTLSEAGLGPDPTLPKDDVDGRFKMIVAEIKNQTQAQNIPIPPLSALPKLPPKPFVGGLYLMPPGVQDARLKEVLKQRNVVILKRQKDVALARNNLAARRTRERREEKEKNRREMMAKLQLQMNWWRLKAISLGANAGAWNAVHQDYKNKMLQDMNEKVCKAESKQSKEIKDIRGAEHSARNSKNSRLTNLDKPKKEKGVQAIIAAIDAKDREIQEAESQGLNPPEMDLTEFINMVFPDDTIHVDTAAAAGEATGEATGDTAEAPTPINDNQNDSINANTSGPININSVPFETPANIGESSDAGGAIDHVNTTDVNNTMDVGNHINNNNNNNNGSMALSNTMDENSLTKDGSAPNTDNMVSALDMNNSSLPPGQWAYQPYTQTDNTPTMSMDFQGAPLNNYDMQDNGMQSSGMQSNWYPVGTMMDNEFQVDALSNFNPQNNDFLSLGSQDNGFMQSNPQDTLFAADDMQNINMTTNGFQRITALDDCTQGSTSLDYPMRDNTPLDTRLYSNASLGNSTQCSTSLDYSLQGDAGFDTSIFSNASIDSGTQNNASFDINFQDNTSVNNGLYGAAPYKNFIQDNASSSTNPQGNGNATNKEKPYRVTKASKSTRASKSNGRNVKKAETARGEITGADLPRVANPTPNNAFNPAVLARARLDHIDHTDRYAFGGRPPSASQQIITPRASDFVNDKYLTNETSFTREGNQSLFNTDYEMYPSDDERNQL
ncbi:uncharacterized protein FPRO_02947 [Fusarium proliferatum ET1]|uniref:BZIP domain-containing protein n=1 Tax=Fusarium proliferatum (strain ET1) TaxID=1227346 RepID=A0A1L7V7K1_FUSPR|nr:uncharacterized protein FPRO_02947 [Fusarium proliferatum ET1]CZR36793.1 uncharacterized protein FPRO_02947 [Fusarium proliferatum ET1]